MIDWGKIRSRMVELGWDEIHQSDLALGRKCRKKLRLYLEAGRQQRGSIQAFLGSVFHRLVHVCYENGFTREQAHRIEPSLLQAAVADVIDAHGPLDFMYQGHRAEPIMMMLVLSRRVAGLSILDLVFNTLEKLEELGFRIEAQELSLRVGPLTGTLDLVVRDGNERGILDTKSYGLWAAWVKGESIKKQSFSELEVAYYPQLRHYHFLYEGQYDMSVDFYGIVCPANTSPYMTGSKKGQDKGEVAFLATARDLGDYEGDLFEWVSSFLDSQPRDYPNNFGKSECPTCPFFKPCLQGTQYKMEEYDVE